MWELGIGDDWRCLNVPAGECLAVSTDTLVSGAFLLMLIRSH